MRKLIIITFFFSIFLTHSALRNMQYAFADDKPAAAAVVHAANVRLQAENAELKEKNAVLQTELNSVNRDREQILEKIKIITAENSKLKEIILYLQTGVLNMDGLIKQGTEDRKEMAERIKKLEKEAQPVKRVKDELNKKIKELESKVRGQSRKIKEILRDQKSGVRKQQTEIRKHESEIKDLNSRLTTQNSLLKHLEEDKVILRKEKSQLEKDLKRTLSELADANKDLKRLKKETADMHYNLGTIFQRQSQWNEAIREYEKVLETRPDDGDVHYNLALIYDSIKNDRFKAIQHYEEYLGINPDGENAVKVKERVTQLGVENKVWGELGEKNIREKKGRW